MSHPEVFKVNTGNPRFINVPMKVINALPAKVQTNLLIQVVYETAGAITELGPFLQLHTNEHAEKLAHRLNVIAAGGRCKY